MKRLYALLLYFFPKAYREEYGEELRTVFALSLDDAMASGGVEVTQVALRELLSLPKAIVHEHLRARRKAHMVRKFGAYFDFTHGSSREFLAAIYPFFLLGGVLPIINMISLSGVMRFPNPLFDSIAILLLAILGILCLIGLAKGLPRWVLPYLGFLLALLSVYIFSGLLGGPIYLLLQGLLDHPSLVGDIFYSGVLWFGLLTALVLLVVMIRTSSTFQHFRKDWTQLCFILYGAVPFALALTFDGYVKKEPYMLLAFLALAVGAWVYLHNNNEWERFGALFGALALAMFIAAGGKAILVPTQDWPIIINSALARSEAKHTIMMWGWFALGMLIPLALKLFPHSKDRLQVA